MELFVESPGLLIGLIGWAATVLLILNSATYNTVQQRTLTVCAWVLWMSPAFGAMVHQGLLTSDAAVVACGGMTVLLALLVSVTAIRWRQHKH